MTLPSIPFPVPSRWHLRFRALGVVGAYALFSALWIYFSDEALQWLLTDPAQWGRWSVYKGIAFVVITSGLLLLLLNRVYGEMVRSLRLLQVQQTELGRLNRLNAVVSQVNQASMRLSRRDELFARVADVLAGAGAFPLAMVCTEGDGDAPEIVTTAGARLVEGEARQAISDASGPPGRAWRENAPVLCNELPGEQAPIRGLAAALALPLRCADHVIGVLCVYQDARGWFGAKEVSLLTEVAADVSFALDYQVREEERRAAVERAENERRFSDTMIESMPGILYFYDQSGRFLRWNQNFERLSGYSGDEIRHMHPLDFFEPEAKTVVASRIGEVFTHGEASVAAPFRARDGTLTPCFFTGRRVVFDGQPCLVGVGIDITERQRAEDALVEAQGRMEVVIENLHEGLIITDPGGDYLHWNPAALRLLGFDDPEAGRRLLPHFPEIFELETLEGDIVPVKEWPLARVRRGDTLEDVQLCVRRRGTEWERCFSYSGSHATYAHGRTMAFLTLADVTAHLQAARMLRLANETLEQRVARRTAELEAARVRAEAADRLKSAFLATMSHELRTPLNSIIGFNGIVLQELAGPLNEEQKKQLGMVRGSALHLLDLINDVLDISKIEAGQLEVRREPFALPESIMRVTAAVRPLADRKSLTLQVRVDQTLGVMHGDRRRVEQILLNLLNNAIKFTETGSVTLAADRIDGAQAPIGVAGPAIRLRITDTGIGIKPEDLKTLFQPFRQIDTGLARLHEGTGLGLAICRRLAQLMGGVITATSEWTKGSHFTVVLPVDRANAP
jgi:PAS domain S-box-containing protein